MSKQPRKKPAASPAQLILVAVLSIVLVGVLASQWMGGAPGPVDDAPAPDQETTVSLPAATDGTKPAAASPFGEFAVDEPWPEVREQDITAHDPLATPDWANPAPDIEALAEREHSEEKLNELRNAQNAIIIMSGDKRIARIGEYEFQVGDTVGGFRITGISPAGVVLSKID